MDIKAALAFSLPLGLGLAALGSGLGLGQAVKGALEATARQPEIANKILIYMTVGAAFIETITIYVLIFAFMYVPKG
jgi:F-type H+-transporting ATPase subunit c